MPNNICSEKMGQDASKSVASARKRDPKWVGGQGAKGGGGMNVPELPPEIQLPIFRYACRLQPHSNNMRFDSIHNIQLYSISLVCKQWRAIVLADIVSRTLYMAKYRNPPTVSCLLISPPNNLILTIVLYDFFRYCL